MHVQGDLDAVIAMAQCLEVYRRGVGSKTRNNGRGYRKLRNQRKGSVVQVEGTLSG